MLLDKSSSDVDFFSLLTNTNYFSEKVQEARNILKSRTDPQQDYW